MIDVSNGNETYYYHYDGSGNVVALSDSAGDTVQTYEYSLYGQVAAEDPNHPNPYMFGGMRFEVETGLYYCGGPLYNPNIGRYLQQNYGIRWQKYSWKLLSAPSPVEKYTGYAFLGPGDEGYVEDAVRWAYIDNGVIGDKKTFSSLDEWYDYVQGPRSGFDQDWMDDQDGWKLCMGGTEEFNEALFWDVQALICIGWEYDFASVVGTVENGGVTAEETSGFSRFESDEEKIYFNRSFTHVLAGFDDFVEIDYRQWHILPELAILGHEIAHAYDYVKDITGQKPWDMNWTLRVNRETYAMAWENIFRYGLYSKIPGYQWVVPRPAYGWSLDESFPWKDVVHPWSALRPDVEWEDWNGITSDWPLK